jgi:hypothetical protein
LSWKTIKPSGAGTVRIACATLRAVAATAVSASSSASKMVAACCLVITRAWPSATGKMSMKTSVCASS